MHVGAPRAAALVDERMQALGQGRDFQQPLHAGEVDAGLIHKLLDEPQPIEFLP